MMDRVASKSNTISVPQLALVVLVGPSGSGKSTFAHAHFLPTEVLSSDTCRGLVADDENDQTATTAAFEVLHFIAGKRLARGRLTVVDATNVQPEARRPLVALARQYHCPAVAIVLNLPERLCQARNAGRADRRFGPHVVRRQIESLRRSLARLEREGFQQVTVLGSPEEVEAVRIERVPLAPNRKGERGPFDIIGDVHGCLEELEQLLGQLGYVHEDGAFRHPTGRRAIFLGDLVDRGPRIPGVLCLAMAMVAAGTALCVPGNHDMKLARKLRGRDVQVAHGLAESLAQLEAEPDGFRGEVAAFLESLPSHLVLDGGALVVAHAGMKESLQGRMSRAVRDFALYGETTGETDEFGLPIRYQWAAEYRGAAKVVYGHTPVPAPEWLNRTINIDTGCVFGGRLTALRYPEDELVSVPAARTYAEPARPCLAAGTAPAMTAQQEADDLLDIDDVQGRRRIDTRLQGVVTIGEEQSIAALEVMSRFAANPKWLVYLPPTMSPCETAPDGEWLEHPAQAFAYYRQEGIGTVVCEEKHMGSRAVVVICRDEDTARRRFGVQGEGRGIVYTRTGRRFFDDAALEEVLLARLDAALERAGLWARLDTDWLVLDCELMPWSAKAQELIRRQYAGVAAAGGTALRLAAEALDTAAARTTEAGDLAARTRQRVAMLDAYAAAYRRYCWPVRSLDDYRLASFHILASEGAVHCEREHTWHMETLAELCAADSALLLATPFKVVDLQDAAAEAAATEWWESLTANGGEGMVVKPLQFVAQGRRGLAQPAVKCRGREYLRIIYGPEYTMPEHLTRLRPRRLGAKRALALREFALGLEALERFVRREPLRRVHECVFGVLALESEPVDPRL